MIRCPVCQNEEYEGSLCCSECGSQIWQVAVYRAADGEAEAGSRPRFSYDSLSAAKKIADRPASPPNVPPGRWQIGLRLQGETLRLSGKDEYHLDRAEAGQSAKPDVDFGPFRAAELGVSRLHALLKVSGATLTLTDLGSTNGTLVNGTRLKPDAPQTVRDGDEVQLGKLSMRVQIEPE